VFSVLKKIGQVIIIPLVGYFILRILLKNWPEIYHSLFTINISALIISTLTMIISFIIMIYLWYRMILRYGVKITFGEAWYIYTKAALIRYIPGNVWGLAAKAYMIYRLGLKKSETIFIIIFESAILVFSGIVVYFLTMIQKGGFLINIIMCIMGILLFIFIVYPRFFLKILHLFYKDIAIRTLPPIFLIKLLVGYLVYWFIYGISFWYLIRSITFISNYNIFIVIGIFAISWVIGFLSLVTPSGLGVREISLIYLLGKFMTIPLATLISLFARIVFILGELISFALSLILRFKTRKDI